MYCETLRITRHKIKNANMDMDIWILQYSYTEYMSESCTRRTRRAPLCHTHGAVLPLTRQRPAPTLPAQNNK